MKILITGATGLIGKEIVSQCTLQGIPVHFLTTSPKKLHSIKGADGFLWDPNHHEIDLDCFKGVTAIVNLAGASVSNRWTRSNKEIILNSRIDTLKTLKKGIEQIERSSLTSFISASAIGKYPNSLTAFYTEKETATDQSFLGKVVKVWEKEIDTLKDLNLDVSIIRVGLVLSASGGALPQMTKPIKNYVGAVFGNGEQWQSWIHVEDVARMFLYVLEKKLKGIFNGVAPNPVIQSKLVQEIAVVLNKPLILPNIPEFMMKLVLGEMAYLLYASQRVSSKKIEQTGFDFKFHNINAALRHIYDKSNTDLAQGTAKSKEFS